MERPSHALGSCSTVTLAATPVDAHLYHTVLPVEVLDQCDTQIIVYFQGRHVQAHTSSNRVEDGALGVGKGVVGR